MSLSGMTSHFANELSETQGVAKLQVHIINDFRQTIFNLPSKESKTISRVKTLFNRSKLSLQNAYQNSLEKKPKILLLHAIKCGYTELVKDLISHNGIDLNTTYYNSGVTPLHISIKNRREKIAKALLKLGAKVNLQDSLGNTALHYATENEMLETSKILLEAGSNPNLQNIKGNTPLHHAADSQMAIIVAHLIKNGANPFIKNSSNQYPKNCVDQEVIKSIFKPFKKDTPTNLNNITKDVRYIIYQYLPTETLCVSMRLVSRSWYNIVSKDLLFTPELNKLKGNA